MPDLRLRLTTALSIVALLAPGVAAQNVLTPGQTSQGKLASGDIKLEDDTYADLWRFSGVDGQRIRITMRSSDFDAYLSLGYEVQGDFQSVDTDDDGGGGTDAQVETRLSRTGEYVVRANTLSKGETGSYTLLLEVMAEGGGGGRNAAPTRVVQATFGQEMRGALEQGDETTFDGTFVDTYTFQGHTGDIIQMTMRSSAFDAYFGYGAVSANTYHWIESNDDGAGGKDARITATLKSDGEYWVRPNTLFKASGPYTLLIEKLSSGSGATAPEAGASGGLEVRAGQIVTGQLAAGDGVTDDGTYADVYAYSGQKDQILIVTLNSPDFRPYLLVGQEGNPSSMETDGASKGEDAKVTVELPATGRYWVKVNSFDKATGSYTLTVRTR
jgi:hypothetical protein